MATTLTTIVQSAAEAATIPLTNKLFKEGVVSKQLWEKKKTTDGGRQINIPFAMSKPGTAKSISRGEQVSYAEADYVQTPALDWAEYVNTVVIPRRDINEASGKAQIFSRVALEMDRLVRELKEKIFTDFWTGDGSNTSLYGVDTWCITTGSYAGINVATYTNWAGNYDSAETDVSDTELLGTHIAATCQDKEYPSHIVSSRGLMFDMMKDIAYPLQNLGAGDTADVGYLRFNFYGIPWIADDLCPAFSIYVLNTNYIDFYVPTGAQTMRVETFDEGDYIGTKLRVSVQCQVACRWPKTSSRIAGVSTCSKA